MHDIVPLGRENVSDAVRVEGARCTLVLGYRTNDNRGQYSIHPFRSCACAVKQSWARSEVGCLLWAKSGLMHRSNFYRYSITSSAVTRSNGGTVRPSALAVFVFRPISNLTGS